MVSYLTNNPQTLALGRNLAHSNGIHLFDDANRNVFISNNQLLMKSYSCLINLVNHNSPEFEIENYLTKINEDIGIWKRKSKSIINLPWRYQCFWEASLWGHSNSCDNCHDIINANLLVSWPNGQPHHGGLPAKADKIRNTYFYPRPVLPFGYCHFLRVCLSVCLPVCLFVCPSVTSLCARLLINRLT